MVYIHDCALASKYKWRIKQERKGASWTVVCIYDYFNTSALIELFIWYRLVQQKLANGLWLLLNLCQGSKNWPYGDKNREIYNFYFISNFTFNSSAYSFLTSCNNIMGHCLKHGCLCFVFGIERWYQNLTDECNISEIFVSSSLTYLRF